MLEASALAKIQHEYRDRRVQVIAVNYMRGMPLAQWQAYLERWGGVDMAYAQDLNFEAMRALNIRTMHSTVIFDRQGEETTAFEVWKEVVEKALIIDFQIITTQWMAAIMDRLPRYQ